MKRTIFLTFLLVLVSLTVSAIPAINEVVVAINAHVLYTNPRPSQPANGFYICGVIGALNNYKPKLVSHCEFVVGSENPDWYLEEYTIEKVPNSEKNWYFTLHFKTDEFIYPGTMMHFGAKFITNYCNLAVVNCSHFDYYRRAVGAVPIIGFNISRNQNFRVDFFNNTNTPVILANLEFAISRSDIPLEAMIDKGLGLPGERGDKKYAELKWSPVKDKFELKPGQEIELNLKDIMGIELKSGDFLNFRAYTIVDGKALPWWGQHQHP